MKLGFHSLALSHSLRQLRIVLCKLFRLELQLVGQSLETSLCLIALFDFLREMSLLVFEITLLLL